MTSTAGPSASVAADAIPAAARAVLADHGVDPDDLHQMGKLGLRRPVRRLGRGLIVLEVAESAAGRDRIRRELWARAWAERAGLSTAVVYGADPDGAWSVAEWVPPSGVGGVGYVERAVEVAQAIAAAAPPAGGPPPSVWRSPRRAVAARTARAITGRMPLRLWWAARSAARQLPRVRTAHGDFYHRNVLWRPDAGEVCVVDWEYLGPGPRHGDLLRMWTVLPDQRDRDALLDRLFTAAPPAQHRDIATLGLWLALRLLGENIKSPRADRNPTDLAHAWSIQPEARALARSHGAWPL